MFQLMSKRRSFERRLVGDRIGLAGPATLAGSSFGAASGSPTIASRAVLAAKALPTPS